MQPATPPESPASSHPATYDPATLPPLAGELLLGILGEMRAQRDAMGKAQELAAAERRSERRWRTLFQVMIFGTPVLLGVIYLLLFLNSTGFSWGGPFSDVVGVVRVEGAIAPGEKASAERIIPALRQAFEDDDVKAVVLSIDSGGGAPTEAERVYSALANLKAKHPKPVTAVINNIGASAAYLIALHADHIVAAKYSIVGSIGAIMEPWNVERALARLNVEQRVYASGRLKSFLNPFTQPSPEVDAKAQRLVDQVGGYFGSELEQRRGQRLRPGVDYATGEVWAGVEAHELGLIDAVGTIDSFVAERYALPMHEFGPRQTGMQLFNSSLQDSIAGALRSMAWSGPLLR